MLGRRFTSSRVRKERKKRLVIQIGLWLVLAASLLFLFVELVDLKQLRVERVRFEGNTAVTDEALWTLVAPYFEGSYAHLFSKKNIFLVPRGAVEKELLEHFVRLEDVSVTRDGLHGIVIRSTEREPAGLWCGEEGRLQTCYYLDENGLAFAPAPKLTGGTFLMYVRTFPERVIGKHLLGEEDFHALGDFINSLVTLGFHTERVTWENEAVVLSVRSSSLEEGRIIRLGLKIPLTPPYDKAFSNLASVIQAADEEEPLSLGDIDYIDIRFENKVFYKKKAQNFPAPIEQPGSE